MGKTNDQCQWKFQSANMIKHIFSIYLFSCLSIASVAQIYVSIWNSGNTKIGSITLAIDLDTLTDVVNRPELTEMLKDGIPHLIGVRRDIKDMDVPKGFQYITRMPWEDDRWRILYDFHEETLGVQPEFVDTSCGSHIHTSVLPDGVWMIVTLEGGIVQLNYAKSVENGFLHGNYYGLRRGGLKTYGSYSNGLSVSRSEQWYKSRLVSWTEFDECGFPDSSEFYSLNGSLLYKWDAKINVMLSFDEDGTLFRVSQHTANFREFGVQLVVDENGQLLEFRNLGPLNSKK